MRATATAAFIVEQVLFIYNANLESAYYDD
jgi:hypothetical protein